MHANAINVFKNEVYMQHMHSKFEPRQTDCYQQKMKFEKNLRNIEM